MKKKFLILHDDKITRFISKRLSVCFIIVISLLFLSFACLIDSVAYNTPTYKENNIDTPIIQLSAASSLNKRWEKIWGGIEFLFCADTELDSQGNIYIVGVSNDGVNHDELILIKFNSLGELQWYRTWGGDDSESGNGVVVDSLDNIYIAGSTQNFGAGSFDMVLVKYDASGVQKWNRTWGTSDSETCHSLAIDSSNNLLLAGRGQDHESIALVKYDSDGNQLWNRTLNFEDGYPTASDILINSLGDIYIAGANLVNNDYYEMILIKFDNAGIHQWNRTWGSEPNYCLGYSIAIDSSNNVYVTGEIDTTEVLGGISYITDKQLLLMKLNSAGIQQWNRTWGGSKWDLGVNIVINSNDNIYIMGRTESFGAGKMDVVLMGYDDTGLLKWSQTWGGHSHDYGSGLTLDDENNIYITGTTRSFHEEENYEIFIVKYGNPEIEEIPLELIIIVSSSIGVGVVITIVVVILTRRRRKLT